jgi:hypothetical protein
MSHHIFQPTMFSEPSVYVTPPSPQLPSYGTMEYAPCQDTIEYDSCEDSCFDDSTIYDSDYSDHLAPYTGPLCRYNHERQDLEWQSPPFCHSVEDCWFIFSYAPIWLTVLVCLMAIIGLGFVIGFLVAVANVN